MTGRIRTAVRVEGVVQGVGFRPFVYGLAISLGLGGLVGNDADGVFAEVEGDPAAVAAFLERLRREPPPLARIDRVTLRDLAPDGAAGFTIAPSRAAGGGRRALVSADTATCADCLAELADPADRRHGYPFINCTNCGPRFTIVRDVPYDRALTTMGRYSMCEACAAEYRDPANRRFHAQPVCCPACGPQLSLLGRDGTELAGAAEAVAAAAGLLRDGQVVAVKGLGGYHLAAAAASEPAAAALRARKHREDKPFAVMVADVAAARELCEVSDAAVALLASPQRPIVLLPRRAGPARPVAAAVAPGNRQLGLMLPYTPVHHLLLGELATPLVLTSGNVSDEPIAYRDGDALRRLAGIADAFLAHDREIHIRADDSVVRPPSPPAQSDQARADQARAGGAAVLRRSRGYAPEPLPVPVTFRRPVLACGAELKSTFCLGTRRQAFISQHIGDLENAETLRSFTEGIAHFQRLFDIEPEVIAHDLHPDYLSTRHAEALARRAGLPLIGVQHHHAHVASCLADNGEVGPVIGVAFDGTGYGTDGTIWGGEFLIADLGGFERAAHLEPVPMPGGAAAIRQPWRMAASYLAALGESGAGLAVRARQERSWPAVLAMAARGINSPATSSAGRLFDAAAALLGVRDEIRYEGQAAIELEQLADPGERGEYRAGITAAAGPLRLAGSALVRAVAEDLTAGISPPVIAARFHNGVAALIEDTCAALREASGITTVALSGGVFQNLLLTDRVIARLAARGFRVLTHQRVPCNDGGISLGQAVIAAAASG